MSELTRAVQAEEAQPEWNLWGPLLGYSIRGVPCDEKTFNAYMKQREPRLYFDRNDWWIGAYRGQNHWYICPLPTLVIRLKRRKRKS